MNSDDPYTIAGVKFHSRLWACTAQNFTFHSRRLQPEIAADVIRESGTEVLVSYIPSIQELTEDREFCAFEDVSSSISDRCFVTLACTNLSATSAEAVEKALRGTANTTAQFIKLEVLQGTRLLDSSVLDATRELVKLGFSNVIPFVTCCRDMVAQVKDLGVPAVRVLASEIGSGRGIDDVDELRYICTHCTIPVITEGGLGTPEHARIAMELGSSAVLINSAIVLNDSPVMIAREMRDAVTFGRSLYLSQPRTADKS